MTLAALLAQLQPFLDHLRRQGFNLGVDSYQRVHAVLLHLAARGELQPARLPAVLMPLLCSSPQEQGEFVEHWQGFFPEVAPEPVATSHQATQQQAPRRPENLHWLGGWMGLILLLPALLGVLWLGSLSPRFAAPAQKTQPIQTRTETISAVSPVAPISTPAVAPPNVQPKAQPTATPIARQLFWLLLAVFLAALARWFWQSTWRQRFLARHPVRITPEQEDYFARVPSKLRGFSSVAFQHAAQQLHKHRELDQPHLDIAATIQRTIAAHGVFTPVFRAHKALPEYLVLIDRASYRDQHSQMVDLLLQKLLDYGLYIERFYFDADPRRCYAANQPAVPLRLDSLQARYPQHHLLVFADSRHFFDPLGRPAPWLAKLEHWAQPVLFTPSPQWDYYTAALEQAGFALFTTGQAGLAQLVAHLARSDVRRQRVADDGYPDLLQQRPLRFVERHTPAPATVETLLAQLTAYLGADGYHWLCALAIYPELHWQLTLGLAPDCAEQETLLLKLTRLPWLRHHYLPDWLRRVLLTRLPASAQAQLRQDVEQLLGALQEKSSSPDDLPLPVARHSLRERFGQEHPLQDAVFLDFMRGELSVQANLPAHRRVPLGLWLLAGALAVSGYYGWRTPPKVELPPAPPPVEKPPVEKPKEPPKPPVASQVPPVSSIPPVQKASAVPPVNPPASRVPTVSSVLPASSEVSAAPPKDNSPAQPPADNAQMPAQRVLPPQVVQQSVGKVSIEMVRIPAGKFIMGCQSGRDKDCYGDESPSHSVSLSAFELGKYEVTQGQWKAVMGSNPSRFKDCGDTCPVETVSWDDIQTFIQKLNAQTGKQYRLPSEAEWEYACRAGQSSNYCGGDNVDSVAWYGYEKSGKTTHPVGKRDANAWGLYDMSGNVWEWVQDSYANYNNAPSDGKAWEGTRAGARVLRGGSWFSIPLSVRAADRNSGTPTVRDNVIGFRLARTLP